MPTEADGMLSETIEHEGFVFPIDVLDAVAVAEYRDAYDDYVASISADLVHLPPRDHYRYLAETHLYLPWVYKLATRESILHAVTSVIGPDLLLWDSRWFSKAPGEPTYVTWHQDGTYWSLDPPLACTAWVALSRSDSANGGMWVISGSHRGAELPHRDTNAEDNALARGQEIAVEVDESRAVPVELEPGQMSLHHIAVVHGSQANTSDEPRIGIALRYIAAHVRQTVQEPLAMLVRGEDTGHHFELAPAPTETAPDRVAELRDAYVARIYRNFGT